ncbi:threonine--tRNA ligase [Ruficoccus sp. ZRK36]|uniref:threonine--tRNA ligase n=1 Tax=Ruficoccus sp. ZRK36 TaxID=2866311 RepID=UPI001C739A15|nr:threonine--tRNA ligase [Ruficoccus sp. ZRK36]QYY34934.1 threonine--tRNA ligase [Ruficoccus sp. ZRK36]
MKAMTPLEELRHSTSHVLATAVLRLFPETKLDIGPPTDTGFYYDFDLEHKFTAEDLEALEAEMKKVIKENQKFERQECSREEATKIIQDFGQAEYKLGRLADIPEGEPISFYRNGDFIDLCAGTHVNYTKKIKAFKLLSVAGAYHRGDEKNKQLQRIYGTAFPTKDELAEYLQNLEEARKRDHRKVGKDMGLFEISEAVGQGLVLWKPAGAVIRQELQDFISEELRKGGYSQVFTPHIGRLGLYRTSGHFPYYQDSQFTPLVDREEMEKLGHEGCSCADLSNKLNEGEADGYLLKPMNCPMHIEIYKSSPHSYRDLPVRLAEFGTVYRWEKSGELNGMTRVRGFTQDDAHIFCTEDQVRDEILACLDLVKTVFNTLGMKDYRVRVGLRDPDSSKYVGAAEKWDKAENALREVAQSLEVPFTEESGEAAFYGPKIDFVVKDVIGREWQLGTVQVDYNLPERFKIEYIGADNQPHRPVMLHRAPFGSMERFVGVLIEHFGGNFPLWLAPEQVRVLPISEKTNAYAAEVVNQLKAAGMRVGLDRHDEKLGAKIRRAELDKVPTMLICGEKEAEAGQVSLRSRVGKSLEGTASVADTVAKLKAVIDAKALPEA